MFIQCLHNDSLGAGGTAGSKTAKNVSANDFDFNDMGDISDAGNNEKCKDRFEVLYYSVLQ